MIFILLVIYQIKHFICDYPLQGKYMLGKFKPYPSFILPLLAHSSVHGLATLAISLFFVPVDIAIVLGLGDLTIHFLVDRVKASPKMLGKYKALSANDFVTLTNLRNEYCKLAPDGHYEIDQIDQKFKYNTYFWWALGADQMAHHLTHYVIIAILLNGGLT